MTMQHAQTVNIETGSNKTTLGKNTFVPYARTTYYGIRSFRVKGPAHWNKIPHNIHSIQSRIVFSKAMKRLSFAPLNCQFHFPFLAYYYYCYYYYFLLLNKNNFLFFFLFFSVKYNKIF